MEEVLETYRRWLTEQEQVPHGEEIVARFRIPESVVDVELLPTFVWNWWGHTLLILCTPPAPKVLRRCMLHVALFAQSLALREFFNGIDKRNYSVISWENDFFFFGRGFLLFLVKRTPRACFWRNFWDNSSLPMVKNQKEGSGNHGFLKESSGQKIMEMWR